MHWAYEYFSTYKSHISSEEYTFGDEKVPRGEKHTKHERVLIYFKLVPRDSSIPTCPQNKCSLIKKLHSILFLFTVSLLTVITIDVGLMSCQMCMIACRCYVCTCACICASIAGDNIWNWNSPLIVGACALDKTR